MKTAIYTSVASIPTSQCAPEVSARASAGHRLELLIRKFYALTVRHRGGGKHQVDGVRCLLHGYHPHLFWQPRPQLILHGPLRVLYEPLPERVVLDASLDYPALHLRPTRCFAHACLPFRSRPIVPGCSPGLGSTTPTW